ncbi:MAG: hypothetical protein K2V38_19905, partial [Gemmataceae bacterium]|nr:hypothetical protein [Gemmataceae bacterium]
MKRNMLGLESLETRDTPSRGFAPGLTFTLPTFQFVSGVVFADANGNGVRDAGENGVNGVRVYADLNNNGVRDANEPSAVTQSNQSISFQNGQGVVTDRPGSYLFNAAVGRNLSSGPIRVELPAGASLTTAVPTFPAQANLPQYAIGLAGVTGTPDTASSGA